MKFTELSPVLLQLESSRVSRHVDTLAEADGVRFLCPKCLLANGRSSIGVHSFICWRPRVPQEIPPNPGRWEFVGSSLDDVSFVAGSSSVAATSEGGCKAHFLVTGGVVTMCPDE